jgi:hypothetical protein
MLRANINRLTRKTWHTTKDSKRFNDPIDLYFEKKGLDFNTVAGPQAFGDSVVSKRHRELAEADLRGSGSSSAWCSAHKGSAAAGRMFEDPGLLRSASAGTLGVWNNNLMRASLKSIGRL